MMALVVKVFGVVSSRRPTETLRDGGGKVTRQRKREDKDADSFGDDLKACFSLHDVGGGFI